MGTDPLCPVYIKCYSVSPPSTGVLTYLNSMYCIYMYTLLFIHVCLTGGVV